jgi:hypothetical protein
LLQGLKDVWVEPVGVFKLESHVYLGVYFVDVLATSA